MAWPSLQQASIITKDQLSLLYTLDKKPVAQQAATFHASGTKAVSLFTTILAGVNKDDVSHATYAPAPPPPPRAPARQRAAGAPAPPAPPPPPGERARKRAAGARISRVPPPPPRRW